MPGPPPTPTALRIVRGNPGKRPLPQNEPHPRAVMPRCPKSVRQNPSARKAWRQLMSLARSMRVLTEADGPLLEKLALSAGRIRWIEAEESKHGLGIFMQIYESKTGAKIGQPSVIYTIYRNEMEFFFRGLLQFGMSPAARPRIQTVGAKSQDGNPFLSLG